MLGSNMDCHPFRLLLGKGQLGEEAVAREDARQEAVGLPCISVAGGDTVGPLVEMEKGRCPTPTHTPKQGHCQLPE